VAHLAYPGAHPSCVSVLFESPTTLVLTGDLAVVIGGGEIGFQENPYIWQAVDRFKAQGHIQLNSVLHAGEDTQPNPHIWYILISK
jgi:hypothetical protein